MGSNEPISRQTEINDILAKKIIKRLIPEPPIEEPDHEPQELISWVDIDFAKYRKANDMTTMRINVSVPKYLKVLGDEMGINFSQELQERLKEKLSVQ